MKLTFHKSIAGRRGAGRRAFSLIEIMVSVSLLSVIIVGLLLMFYQVQRAFRAGTTQVDILEGGRATMNILVRDLQEMTASELAFVTNCVIVASPGAVETTQTIPTGSVRENFYQNIAFLSRNPARDEGEWGGTAYHVSNAVSGVGVLYRFVTNRVRETLPHWNSNSIVEVSDAISYRIQPGDPRWSRVMDGIVSLKITPVFTNGIAFFDNDPVLFPGRTGVDSFGNQHTNASFHVVTPHFFGFIGDGLPAYVDVELAILEPSTLAKFRAQSEVSFENGTNYLSRQIGRTHVFRQRVAIRPATAQLRSLTFN